MSTTCPGCGGPKTKKAVLCASCRKTATALGASVLTHVATPAQPFVPRTPKQNAVFYARLRDLALCEQPGLEGPPLWQRERELKRWAVGEASKLVGRNLTSSTELSEIEMERFLEFLADRVDAGKR